MQTPADQLNGNVFIVSVSKKFWLDNLPDLQYDSPLEIHFRTNREVKAFLIYQKNKHVKLVPYLKQKMKNEIASDNPQVQKID